MSIHRLGYQQRNKPAILILDYFTKISGYSTKHFSLSDVLTLFFSSP